MIVYFIIAAFVFICSFLMKYILMQGENKKNKVIIIIISIVLVLILSFFYAVRSLNVGTDTLSYYNIYHHELGNEFGANIWKFEIGFSLLSMIMYSITTNFYVFMFIVALIMFSNIIFVTMKLSRNFVLSNVLFITLGFYMQSFNIIRQYIALSFILLALYFLIKKENKLFFLIFIILGSLFHKTAIIGLAFLLIYHLNLNIKNLAIISSLSLLIILFFPQITTIFDLLLGTTYYVNYQSLSVNILKWDNVLFLISGILCIIFPFVIKRFLNLEKIDKQVLKEYNFFSWLLILWAVIKIISIFTVENVDRLGIYCLIGLLYIIPIIVELLFNKKKRLINNIILIMSIIFMYLLISVYGAYGVYPYTFMF